MSIIIQQGSLYREVDYIDLTLDDDIVLSNNKRNRTKTKTLINKPSIKKQKLNKHKQDECSICNKTLKQTNNTTDKIIINNHKCKHCPNIIHGLCHSKYSQQSNSCNICNHVETYDDCAICMEPIEYNTKQYNTTHISNIYTCHCCKKTIHRACQIKIHHKYNLRKSTCCMCRTPVDIDFFNDPSIKNKHNNDDDNDSDYYDANDESDSDDQEYLTYTL